MERLEASDEFTLDITVGDPQKVGELMWPCWAMMCHVIESVCLLIGDGMGAYMTYQVTTKVHQSLSCVVLMFNLRDE